MKLTASVSGMTCDHCAVTIERALNRLPKVTAQVSYETGLATVIGAELRAGDVLDAIAAKGYDAKILACDGDAVFGDMI